MRAHPSYVGFDLYGRISAIHTESLITNQYELRNTPTLRRSLLLKEASTCFAPIRGNRLGKTVGQKGSRGKQDHRSRDPVPVI